MNDPKIVQIVDKIVIIHQGKTFAHFDSCDIAQEIRLMCCRKLDGYNVERAKPEDYYKGLEHWLNRVVRNGLRNLYRDNMGGAVRRYKGDTDDLVEQRSKLAHAASLEEGYYHNANLAVDTRVSTDYEFDTGYKYMVGRLDAMDNIVLEAIGGGCEVVGHHYRGRLLANLKVINDEVENGH
jgi:hypothetical protein